MNGYDTARDQGQGVLQSFDDGAIRATSKFLSPFVEESIAFGFMADVFLRGGETREGRRLWNPEDSFGNKLAAELGEMAQTAGEYEIFFGIFVFCSIFGILVILINKPLKRLTHGLD